VPIDRDKLRRFGEAVDNWLAAGKADSDEEDDDPLEAPTQPFNDSPPEMQKEPLWGGRPPIPISHL
jgi:hypothetical protein